MRPLLLTDWGTCLKTRDRRLIVKNQDTGATREYLPADFPYDSIIIEHLGGFVTFPALRWLASNGVSLTALGFDGQVLASYLPEAPQNPHARIAQLAAYLDPSARVRVARFILEAKVGKVPAAYKTWNSLLTFEGREAARYWTRLGITRDFPHARDPVNACLNYAYGLLASRARLAAHRSGLLPEIGFLHTPQNYKEALTYDLVEPFRAPTTTTALSVARDLTSRDFGEVFGHGLRLRPEAAHRLVTAFARGFSERGLSAFTARLTLRLEVEGRRAAPRLYGRDYLPRPADPDMEPNPPGPQTWGQTESAPVA